MSTASISIQDMTPEQLELHCRNIAGGRSKAASDSFRTLRLASGFSQEKTGQMCNRQPNSISDYELNVSWPSDPEITFCKLLSSFGVPYSMLASTFETDIDETLSVKSYLANDPIQLEHWWFKTKTGKILSQLGKRCEQGSHAHMRLFFELRSRNQELVNSRLSASANDRTPIKMIEEKAKWLSGSVSKPEPGQSPDPGQSSESKPDPGPKPALSGSEGKEKAPNPEG